MQPYLRENYMWEKVFISVFWDIIQIALPAPIIGYVAVYFTDELAKAWKTNNQKRKWLICSSLSMVVVAFFKYVCGTAR